MGTPTALSQRDVVPVVVVGSTVYASWAFLSDGGDVVRRPSFTDSTLPEGPAAR